MSLDWSPDGTKLAFVSNWLARPRRDLRHECRRRSRLRSAHHPLSDDGEAPSGRRTARRSRSGRRDEGRRSGSMNATVPSVAVANVDTGEFSWRRAARNSSRDGPGHLHGQRRRIGSHGPTAVARPSSESGLVARRQDDRVPTWDPASGSGCEVWTMRIDGTDRASDLRRGEVGRWTASRRECSLLGDAVAHERRRHGWSRIHGRRTSLTTLLPRVFAWSARRSGPAEWSPDAPLDGRGGRFET